MKTLTTEVKQDITAFVNSILPELKVDVKEYGEAQLTVACDDEGASWNYQTGDNSYTGGAYGLPHWAVVWIDEDTEAADLATDIISQLEELLPEDL